MRVEVTPRHCSVVAGQSTVITVSVTNSASIISGHRIRVLGVDPRWVSLDQDNLSLFPDATGVAVATVTLPPGLPAGPRTFAIEVTELTPPHETALVDVEVTVPAEPKLTLAVDPVSVMGGRSAKVAVIAQNTGNSVLDPALDGRDETGDMNFAFDQTLLGLTPGEQRVGQATLRAKRPWFGSPKIRQYTIVGGPPGAPVVAAGTWLQKPRLSRGAIALTGLLAAATVFAIVVAVSLSSVVSTSNSDRNLALQVAQASQGGNANAGTAGVSGVATQAGSNQPVSGVTVDIYQPSNITAPIVSTATSAQGAYTFTGLAAGSYLLQFQGAGFASLWYPNSLTSSGATQVSLKSAQVTPNVNVSLGGLPGTISGQVVGADPTGAILTLEVPGAGGIAAAAAAAVNAAPAGSAPANAAPAATATTTTPTTAPATTNAATNAATAALVRPEAGTAGSGQAPDAVLTAATSTTPSSTGSAAPAIMNSQILSASGAFTVPNVPSPGIFDLVVVKTGYAPAVAEVDLSGGESRTGIVITLHKGDGTISGTVSTSAGPLGGAGIAASDGTNTVSTVSETAAGSVGQFQLADLPTPDTLTVVVTANGYASQTLSVTLAPHEQLTGLSVLLVPGTGSVSGTVTSAGKPAGGVTVTATNGQQTVSTVSLSVGPVGTYQLTGLAVPGNYTLTFSRPDLSSQSRAIALTDAQGTVKDLDPDLVPQTATVYGTITQTDGQAVHDVTIQLSSGNTTYQVTSADTPTAGAYEIDGITPGTYTISFSRQGGQPVSSIVSLAAGQRLDDSPVLAPAASIYGVVVDASTGKAVAQAQLTLYLASQYPTVIAATTQTNSSGQFTFTNVDAPQNYIVGVAYPLGSSNQETVLLTTARGAATPVCGSKATGQAGSVPATTATTTATAPGTSSPSSSTTTSTTTTTTTVPSNGTGTCNPQSDPLRVILP